MAGTLTITSQSGGTIERPVRKLTLAWTSDAAGAVSDNLTDYVSGVISRVVFVPGSGGDQPTDLYDATLLDESGIDLLAGQGANLSNSAASSVIPGETITDGTTTSIAPFYVDDKLELVVANAGDTKAGTVTLYLRA